MARLDDLRRFYDVLEWLERRVGGPRLFSDLGGRQEWPARGVYFIFEPDEQRRESGTGLRVVRVGTHATTLGSRSTLRQRLAAHRGTSKEPGGNHRGSIFRLLVGNALQRQTPALDVNSWGHGSTAPREVRIAERTMEARVSERIGAMRVLWIGIDDSPGPDSDRVYVERNAIALLSNWNRPPIDPPSREWLGLHCTRAKVRESGLWNNQHVDETHDPAFIDKFAQIAGI